MTSINLNRSLSQLYAHSSTFPSTLDLIQRLAQQNRLETFIEQNDNNHRLTIAGSTILLELDFNNKLLSNVSLNSFNKINKIIYTSHDSLIKIDLSSGPSFLGPIPINIIKNNLSSPTLNHFPSNLHYLAQIDKNSLNFDLFTFIENLALVFEVVNKLELSDNDTENLNSANLNSASLNSAGLNSANTEGLRGENVEFTGEQSEGFSAENLIGKLSGELVGEGLKSGKLVGELSGEKDFGIEPNLHAGLSNLKNNSKFDINDDDLMDIDSESNNSPISKYFTNFGKVILNDENTNQLGLFLHYWQDFRFINHKSTTKFGKDHKILLSVEPSLYTINYFELDLWNLLNGDYTFNYSQSNPIQSIIKLNFNYEIWLPKFLLKYYNYNYDIKEIKDEIYQDLNNFKDIIKQFSNIEFKINQQSFEFLPIKSFELKRLSELPKILSFLRSFIILNNLITTSLNSKEIKPRRNSRVGELSEDARKKLRDSLKLPDDVTDEELRGLNINENFMKPNDDIDTFMSQQLEKQKIIPYVKFTIVNFDFELNEINLYIEGFINEKIYIPFKISNGCIIDENNSKVVKALDMTEDIYSTVRHFYK